MKPFFGPAWTAAPAPKDLRMCGLHRFVWDAQFFPQRHASSRQWAPFRTGLGCRATPIGIGIFSGPRRTPPCPGQKIRFSILAGLIESLLSRQGHLGPGLRGPGGRGQAGSGRAGASQVGPGRAGLGWVGQGPAGAAGARFCAVISRGGAASIVLWLGKNEGGGQKRHFF